MKKITEGRDRYIYDDSTTRIARSCRGCGEHQTIAGALLKSPQWEAWYKHASEKGLFDVDETETIDAMSDKHFAEFMRFSGSTLTKEAQ